MDIHRPKAAHSWREFLIEIGTIVCGILIALGLEQAIEVMRTNSEVREAREAVHEELMVNASKLLFGREEDKCLLQQVDAYASWARGGPKPPPLRTNLAPYGKSTWDSVKTSAVPHMPLHERRSLAAFYDSLANEQGLVDIQRSSSLVLVGAAERDTLDREDAVRVLDAVATERLLTRFHLEIATGLVRRIEDLGVKVPPLSGDQQADIAELCGRSGR